MIKKFCKKYELNLVSEIEPGVYDFRFYVFTKFQIKYALKHKLTFFELIDYYENNRFKTV